METKETLNSTETNTPKIVLACSGASDLGELSDRVARKLGTDMVYRMKCLAMVGAGDKELAKSLKNSEVLVIDGCSVDCGKKIMEEAWLTNYQYLRLTDLGLLKGKTPVTNELIDEVSNKIKSKINVHTIEQSRQVASIKRIITI